MDIYINEKEKLELFEELLISDREEQRYLLSADHLERICLGKTYLPDYAYSKIRSQLKKEFKIWKESR